MDIQPTATSKRQILLMVFTAICGTGALMGTLPIDSKDLPMPPEWRPYIISIGFAGLTIEKWGKFLIAIINNYKLASTLLLLFCFMLLNSCGIVVTEDGCILGNYKHGNSTYAAGPCVGANSEVDRFRVQWENDAKQKLRATYWTKQKKPALVEYFTGDLWLKWTSKSGVLIGPVPPEVEKALDGEPKPIPAPVAIPNPLNVPSA